MDTLKAIETRRSVRQFDPHAKIDSATERALIEAARMAPSAYNLQHCSFVVVRDRAILEKIEKAAGGQKQVCQASLYVVVCANTQAWKDNLQISAAGLPEPAKQAKAMLVRAVFENNERACRDEAVRSGALAAQTLMLAATAMGYATNAMTGFDHHEVAKAINMPPTHVIAMAVAIGKPLVTPAPRGEQTPYEKAVLQDHF